VRKAEKVELVAQLKDMLSQSKGLIAVNYSRLNAGQMDVARRVIRETGATLRVVKNTLFNIAVRDTVYAEMVGAISGAVALVTVPGDVQPVLKALSAIGEQVGRLEVQCGYLGGRLRDSAEMTELANLPPREQLAARLVGVLRMPLTNLVRLLRLPLLQLAHTLQLAAEKAAARPAAE